MFKSYIRKLRIPAHTAVCLLLWILFMLYPLYVKSGYVGIDSAKYHFLWNTSRIGIIVISVCLIIQLILGIIPSQIKARLSIVDGLVLVYGVLIGISLLMSVDRNTAFYGQTGWYMGAGLIWVFCILYFLISRCWMGDIVTIYSLYIGSGMVFVLGLINRFDVWTRQFPYHGNGNFISTLGNIGWFCGYLSIFASFGVGTYLIGRNHTKIQRLLISVYVFISFAISLSQGGDSIILYFAVLFIVSFAMASMYEDGLLRWIELIMIWCLAGQFIHVLRMIWPKRFTYASANFCNSLNNTFFTLWLFIIFAAIYLAMKRFKYIPSEKVRKIMRYSTVVVVVMIYFIILGIVLYSTLSSNHGEVDISNQYDEKMLQKLTQKLFYFDESWGSGRGGTILGGIKVWSSMSLPQKLLGVGPDCFAAYAYSVPEVSVYLGELFRGEILTNAHNELLTCLIDIGILGTLAYSGIFAVFFYQVYKWWRHDTRLLYIALSLVCYLGYNLLNYQQILNYPFAFLMLGIGETWIKQAKIRMNKR